MKSNLLLAAAGAALLLLSNPAQAQERPGRGGDPEEFRTRMMERYREQLSVSSEDEWKIIETRIQGLMESRRELGALTPRGGRGFGPGGPGGRGGRGDDANRGGDENRRRRGGFFGEPSPKVEALQKAVESNASADDIKAKLADLRAARKEQEAKVTKAEEDLRQVLSVKQEASAVLMGLLN